jgi:hypothetical protein
VLLRLLEAGAKVKWGATPLVDVECYINTGSPEENMKSGHTATYYDAGRSAYQVVVGGHFNGVHPPGVYFLSTQFRAWNATYFDNVRIRLKAGWSHARTHFACGMRCAARA